MSLTQRVHSSLVANQDKPFENDDSFEDLMYHFLNKVRHNGGIENLKVVSAEQVINSRVCVPSYLVPNEWNVLGLGPDELESYLPVDSRSEHVRNSGTLHYKASDVYATTWERWLDLPSQTFKTEMLKLGPDPEIVQGTAFYQVLLQSVASHTPLVALATYEPRGSEAKFDVENHALIVNAL